MKFNFNHPTRITTSKGKTGIVTGETHGNYRVVMLMLIILVIALTACNLPRKKTLSGAQVGASASTVTVTPINQADAGGAVLNLRRDISYDYPTGSDIQSEVGTIPLVFTKSTEGPLIVEGKGKTEWTEVTNFKGCSYTSKAEGNVIVTGLFRLDDCMFHLTIATKFSQPTTTYQEQSPDVCTGSIHFTETEFSSQIELDPHSARFKETKEKNWLEMTTVNLTELKSDVVQNCFKPEVIERSK